MTDNEIKESIKKEEGFQLAVYEDSRGIRTVGYGHALHVGSTIPAQAAELIFESDYQHAVFCFEKLNLDLDSVRRSAVIDMIFNMGLAGVVKFEHFIFALRHGDYIRAANELMDSKYARQLPARAKRNRDKIIYGDKYHG